MKLNLNKIEYLEFRNFWAETRQQQITELPSPIYIIPMANGMGSYGKYINDILLNNNGDLNWMDKNPAEFYLICETNSIEDLWLAKNCKISFIREQLRKEYPNNWIGFREGTDFGEQPRFIQFETDNSRVFLYRDGAAEGEVEYLNGIVIYGTSFACQFIHDSVKNVTSTTACTGLTTSFYWYGHFIKNVEGTNYITEHDRDVEVSLGEIPVSTPWKDMGIRYTLSLDDAANYKTDEAIISLEGECFPLTDLTDADIANMKEHIHILPEYIRTQIR